MDCLIYSAVCTHEKSVLHEGEAGMEAGEAAAPTSLSELSQTDGDGVAVDSDPHSGGVDAAKRPSNDVAAAQRPSNGVPASERPSNGVPAAAAAAGSTV